MRGPEQSFPVFMDERTRTDRIHEHENVCQALQKASYSVQFLVLTTRR